LKVGLRNEQHLPVLTEAEAISIATRSGVGSEPVRNAVFDKT